MLLHLLQIRGECMRQRWDNLQLVYGRALPVSSVKKQQDVQPRVASSLTPFLTPLHHSSISSHTHTHTQTHTAAHAHYDESD